MSLVTVAVFPVKGFSLAVAAWPTAATAMAAAVVIFVIALARGTDMAALVSLIVTSSTAVASILSEWLLIAIVARATAIALGFSSLREMVKSTDVETTRMLEAHAFSDILHQCCVEVLVGGKAMLLIVGMEVSLLDLVIRGVWLHAAGQSLCVADALFELAEMMIGVFKRMLRVSCIMVTPLEIAGFL